MLERRAYQHTESATQRMHRALMMHLLFQDVWHDYPHPMPDALLPEYKWKSIRSGKSIPREWKDEPMYVLQVDHHLAHDYMWGTIVLQYNAQSDRHSTSVSVGFANFCENYTRSYYYDDHHLDVAKADVERIITAYLSYQYHRHISARPRLMTLDGDIGYMQPRQTFYRTPNGVLTLQKEGYRRGAEDHRPAGAAGAITESGVAGESEV